MSNISRKIQADKGMTGGVSHFKAADWSKGFVCKFIFSLTSYSVPRESVTITCSQNLACLAKLQQRSVEYIRDNDRMLTLNRSQWIVAIPFCYFLHNYHGWWVPELTARSCICFGHSNHYVAQIYPHQYVIFPIVYVLMYWHRGRMLSRLGFLYWKLDNSKWLSVCFFREVIT